MIKSLYDGAAAMHVIHRQHEQTSNNLANVNTGGFRRVILGVHNRTNTNARGVVGSGPQIQGAFTDFSSGRLIDSRRSLDFAISGDGFFKLQANNGAELFTKDGRFFRNYETGQLVNVDNVVVLGEDGPIDIPPDLSDSAISVGPDGTLVAGDQRLGKLSIAQFENNNSLVPVGQTSFRRGNDTVDKDEVDVQVRQFFHEVSNINPTGELINLIVGGRHYEAIQKATRTIADALQQSIRG